MFSVLLPLSHPSIVSLLSKNAHRFLPSNIPPSFRSLHLPHPFSFIPSIPLDWSHHEAWRYPNMFSILMHLHLYNNNPLQVSFSHDKMNSSSPTASILYILRSSGPTRWQAEAESFQRSVWAARDCECAPTATGACRTPHGSTSSICSPDHTVPRRSWRPNVSEFPRHLPASSKRVPCRCPMPPPPPALPRWLSRWSLPVFWPCQRRRLGWMR
mmetsp:Transcript_1850/g.3083  ORF Transcript_1850/g.3083 Transcript_1850/m.3083 type:complete len:213 (-) Transcript_1850:68-706(-)